MKVLSFISVLVSILICSSLTIHAAPGDVDMTFGNNGKSIFRIGGGQEGFYSVIQQPDGKLLVGGQGDGRAIVLRYNSNGSLDTSFGNGGVAMPGPDYSWVLAKIALQSDGKIVVAGRLNLNGSRPAFLVFRLQSNGSLDRTFNNNGFVVTRITEYTDALRDVAIQPDGKIVVVGQAGYRGIDGGDVGIARYNSDGSLDFSFGVNGIRVVDIANKSEAGYAVKLQDDGRIIVLAASESQSADNFLALLRLLPDGTADKTFGQNGISLTSLGAKAFELGDIAIQSDGKIVVATSPGSNQTFVYESIVFRFASSGSSDNSFGNNGRTIVASGDSNKLYALAIQRNGKIVATGYTTVSGGNFIDILTVRLNAAGSFDTSFGVNGKVLTAINPGTNQSDGSYDLLLQPDGKIVVVGSFTVTGIIDDDAFIIRYQGDDVAQSSEIFDFDGDGKADVSVFRPSNGIWYLQQSSAGFTGTQFGLTTDQLVPADYDSDGKTDVAVYRGGTWYLQRSQLGFTGIAFGASDDIPVPADYDGDGKADLAVFRPSNGVWYLQRSQLGFTGIQFGQSGDKPVAADYDGDGKADLAVNRSGTWYLQRSTLGFTGFAFGDGNDKLVPADYDGDGKSDVAVFRPSNGIWYLQQSTNGFTGIQFGLGTDTPTAADYDGDGKADLAVFRNGTWYLNRSSAGFTGIAFGAAADLPIPNAFVR